MLSPPLMTLLGAAPEPFFASDLQLNGDWYYCYGPGAVYYPALDQTVVAWYMVGTAGTSDKGARVAAYDHATATWSPRFKAGAFALADDDHGIVSVVQDADGFFYLFYGSHDTVQRWSISNSPNDITAWTQQSSLSGNTTYPHTVLVGSTIWLIARNDVVSSNRPVCIRSATPVAGAATFSALVNIIDLGADSRCYISNLVVVGTEINFSVMRSNAADTERKHIYYFVYETTTGAIRNSDGSVTVAAASLPISLATANASFRLFDSGGGRGDLPSLCFDSAGDPHLIFLDNGGSGLVFNLLHIKRTAGVWSSPVTIAQVVPQFVGTGFISIYAIVTGAAGTVQAWYNSSTGNKLRRDRSSSGLWSAEQLVAEVDTNWITGALQVANASPDLRVFFCDASASRFDADAILSRRFGYGDNGWIRAEIDMSGGDPLFASVALLFGFDQRDGAAGFINDSDSCFIQTATGNAQADTAQFKFGTASLALDGASDFLTVPSNALLSVSNGDFCVECFVRRTGASKLQAIAAKRPGAGVSEWATYINVTTNALLFQAFDASVAVVALAGTTALLADTWYHVAFSRQGTTWRIFLDGALEASGSQSAAPVANSIALHIGRDLSNVARDFRGFIDEFRFTAGNARYTAPFTPPTAAFPRW